MRSRFCLCVVHEYICEVWMRTTTVHSNRTTESLHCGVVVVVYSSKGVSASVSVSVSATICHLTLLIVIRVQW